MKIKHPDPMKPEEIEIKVTEQGELYKLKLMLYERGLLKEAIEQNNFNISATARVLGFDRKTIYNKIKLLKPLKPISDETGRN